MTFKTKAIGLLAGSALALSLATGAIAQTESTATVTLAEKQNAQGCTLVSVTMPALESTWNGSSYTDPPTAWAYTTLGFDPAAPGETGTCDVSVWGTDFEGQTDSTNSFGVNRLMIGGYTVSGDSTQPARYLANWPAGGTPQSQVALDLSDVTVPPDEYVSTLTFTITNHE